MSRISHADPRRPLPEREAEEIADVMFALSAPHRVLLLGCLLARPQSVSDLIRATGMEQSAVSHQLRILREHGLVAVERRGRQRIYSLSDQHVNSLLEEARRHVEHRTG